MLLQGDSSQDAMGACSRLCNDVTTSQNVTVVAL